MYIFETICAACENIRKYLQDCIAGFIRRCVIPNLMMSDADYNEWLTSAKDYEYEDNSMQAACEDCIETISKTLGK